jgi:hypothetical protein
MMRKAASSRDAVDAVKDMLLLTTKHLMPGCCGSAERTGATMKQRQCYLNYKSTPKLLPTHGCCVLLNIVPRPPSNDTRPAKLLTFNTNLMSDKCAGS